jgi:hypothetical protein
VLEVGHSRDAFAVAEANLDRFPGVVLDCLPRPDVRDFWQKADDTLRHAVELRNAEKRNMERRIAYIEEFIWDFSEHGALTWPKSIRRLAHRYEQLQAESAYEYWMGAVDVLISEVRQRCPQLSVAEALFAMLPRNIAIPRDDEARSEDERTPHRGTVQ